MVVVVANIMEKFKTNNTNADPFIRNTEDTNPAKFGHINAIVDVITQLQNTPPGSGITSITSNNGSITIDNTDPSAPDLSAESVFSTDGSTEAYFRSSNGTALFARLTGTNFEQPFLIKNDSLIAKIGFFDKSNTNVLSSQAASISDATDEASAITAINSLLAAMRAYGLIAE